MILACMIALCSCKGPAPPSEGKMIVQNQKPVIFPDFTDVTIPPNIAPLNFEVLEEGEIFMALLQGDNGTYLRLRAKNRTFRIPPGKWKEFITANKGSLVSVKVFKKLNNQWSGFSPFQIRVASEPIDPYLVYRLIPPGYETWSAMGLYQRDLTSFRETPVIENKYLEDNCVNCHSFGLGSSENMLFHIRGSVGGTMIKQGDHHASKEESRR